MSIDMGITMPLCSDFQTSENLLDVVELSEDFNTACPEKSFQICMEEQMCLHELQRATQEESDHKDDENHTCVPLSLEATPDDRQRTARKRSHDEDGWATPMTKPSTQDDIPPLPHLSEENSEKKICHESKEVSPPSPHIHENNIQDLTSFPFQKTILVPSFSKESPQVANTPAPLDAPLSPHVRMMAVQKCADATPSSPAVMIHLDPPHLGAVHVRMQVDTDQRVSLHISTTQAETLNLMQDHVPAIQKIFEESHMLAPRHQMNFSMQNMDSSSHDRRHIPHLERDALTQPTEKSTQWQPSALYDDSVYSLWV